MEPSSPTASPGRVRKHLRSETASAKLLSVLLPCEKSKSSIYGLVEVEIRSSAACQVHSGYRSESSGDEFGSSKTVAAKNSDRAIVRPAALRAVQTRAGSALSCTLEQMSPRLCQRIEHDVNTALPESPGKWRNARKTSYPSPNRRPHPPSVLMARVSMTGHRRPRRWR